MTTQSSLSAIAKRVVRTALVLSAMSLAGPAAAGGYHDRVHADSFGNLIIYSPSGYKRIVVGQGHLAQDLADYTRGGAPDVVYLDPSDGDRVVRRCRSQGVLLHGRSYMYGLPDNVVPVLEHPCARP
ncbi:hypothetical protein [Aquibium sp. ELW1220]|uniref:hypothetical protein n=1 Tax=Aquibium sp. ELW1220 TaxID=2976766 RepID=UPI0025B1959B|nr:hypothetical protein [Aquibium sp. ELW1220]MDN2582588.1 hypothetical protein [Aquibium sp. ELW1220]